VIDCLLEAPDRALYQMKRSGGAAVAGPSGLNRVAQAFRDIVFRSPTFPFLGRRTEEYRLSDRQSTDASDRAVDSRGVLVHTNDRLQHFWRRTCRVGIKTTDAPKRDAGMRETQFSSTFRSIPDSLG
jgi:hypothetical protein